MLLEGSANNQLKMICCTPTFILYILLYQSKAGAIDLYKKTIIR